MEKLIIREVRQSDAKDLQKSIFPLNTPEEVEERVSGSIRMADAGEGINLVAEADGVVIGTMTMQKETMSLHAHICSLNSVVVVPDFQRTGIARKMFNECKKIAAEKGFKLITVSCRAGTPAEEVYKRLGFIEIGRVPNGLVEPWGDKRAFDEVFFYQEVL